jgi:hypothetical protein
VALDRWYLTLKGSHHGPFSTTALLDLLASGQVDRTEWVWPEGVDVGITVQQFLERIHAETLPGWMEVPPLPYIEGWYHIQPQEKCGPFARETLVELAVQGKLRPDDVIWRHDASGWTSFSAKQVIAFPPPGSPWPSWVKEIAQAENVTLAPPRSAAPMPQLAAVALPDWMSDLQPTASAACSQAAALPDWMKDTPPDFSPAQLPPTPAPSSRPPTPVPDWLDDIRTIEEALRRRFVLALARPAMAPTTPEPAAPPSRDMPVLSGSLSPLVAASKQWPWPLSQDYNEAIQCPAQCFADPELRQGTTVTGPGGLPIPCAGNFADVDAVQTPGRKWAVKCFTRQIPGIRERYIEISKYLQQVQLPFLVEFQFQDQGIHVWGQWYPILKMQWVEGMPLNAYVQQHLDQPPMLQRLARMWVKLATSLRTANLAHGDLQHGNVLLAPGKRAGTFRVQLVDYDGMCVPALDLLKPIEVGHSAYQHPQRLREGTYGLEIDRFSHLVIYTALRGLVLAGRRLWDRFDNGDNLLFTPEDFHNPRGSPLFRELVKLDDAEMKKLAQALAIASQKPLEETPLLADLVSLSSAPSPANDTDWIDP